MSTPYIPDIGDIVSIDFNPQAGREQAKRRPALVLSPASYNQLSSLVIVCPITSQKTRSHFLVLLSPRMKTTGCVLSDQVKSLDWRVRQASFIEKADDEIVEDVRAKLAALLGIS
ncbi:type II toxin-antitoxin system PemK/MazF family toxin [Myxococcota bacterium]|nr:type II toxin-antitoxin system PemK/MazF family toxin [Myxococcota bacterium]